MTRTLRKLCFLFLILLLPLMAAAQEKADASASAGQQAKRPRPKIGIALEGGGALGLAHIGVLEWFEEHRIPVDYIAGTSMGGLVGGLYSTGKTPQELEDLSRNRIGTSSSAGKLRMKI